VGVCLFVSTGKEIKQEKEMELYKGEAGRGKETKRAT